MFKVDGKKGGRKKHEKNKGKKNKYRKRAGRKKGRNSTTTEEKENLKMEKDTEEENVKVGTM
jgi:hypothetical protein